MDNLWLPIESAPTDGTAVLLFFPPTVYGRQCFVVDAAHFYIGKHSTLAPTHWMPLPKAPQS